MERAERFERHPLFYKAMGCFSLMAIRLYQEPGLTRFLVNETARNLIANLCIIFDAQSQEDPSISLTVTRVQDACEMLGLASRGRVYTFIKMMEVAGYLQARPGVDRRTRKLVPSARFVGHIDTAVSAVLEGVDILLPEPVCVQRFNNPMLRRRYILVAGVDMLAGFEPWNYYEDMRPFTARDGGFHILSVILEQAGAFERDIAGGTSVSVALADLGRKNNLSRSHLRQLLADAEERGLIAFENRGSYDIILTPRLISLYRAHVALLLAHSGEIMEWRVGP